MTREIIIIIISKMIIGINLPSSQGIVLLKGLGLGLTPLLGGLYAVSTYQEKPSAR